LLAESLARRRGPCVRGRGRRGAGEAGKGRLEDEVQPVVPRSRSLPATASKTRGRRSSAVAPGSPVRRPPDRSGRGVRIPLPILGRRRHDPPLQRRGPQSRFPNIPPEAGPSGIAASSPAVAPIRPPAEQEGRFLPTLGPRPASGAPVSFRGGECAASRLARP